MHLVKWKVLCRTKKEGGIGVRQAEEMNKLMLACLVWLLLKKPEALWSQVLRAKKSDGRDGLSLLKQKSRSSHVWCEIVQGSEALKGARWRMGNGKRINFWSDSWV